MPTSDRPTCFLFDNGSLRAAATRSLRELAARLQPVIGAPVRAVSLLHSSGVDAAELDGRPAELLEPALLEWAKGGGVEAILLPLFFGPSGALTDYVPGRLAAVRRQHPHVRLHLARWLVQIHGDDSMEQISQMLADAVRATIRREQLTQPGVLLTDHGSPQLGVTAVRNALGARLREQLRNEAGAVGVASMERREGAAYAFNDPLLEHALRQPPFDHGHVVVALQFLQAGRHAGPDGDVAAICAAAERDRPGLRTHLTDPLVGDDRLVTLLRQRYEEAIKADSAAR